MQTIKNINQLYYLKGYLTAFAALNSFCDDNKTYTIELLDKSNNNITDTLKSYYNKKHWIFNTEKIVENWQEFLAKDIRHFFDQIIIEVFKWSSLKEFRDENGSYKNDIRQRIEELRNNEELNIDFVVGKFVQNLKNYVGEDTELVKIEVNWHPPNAEYEGFYALYACDYIFDLGDNYLYLHLKSSD